MREERGADVIVIGAGAIGCAVSWRLRQAGLSVILLERGEPGGEASSAAAGILGAQMEAHQAGPLLSLQLASRALHPQLARELLERTGIDVGCRIEGVLEHAFDEAELAALRARFEWQRAAGLCVEWFEHKQLAHKQDPRGGPAPVALKASAEYEPADQIAPGALAALLLADDGQVDNRSLSRALRIAAEQAGVSIVRGEACAIEERRGWVTGVRIADVRDAPDAEAAKQRAEPIAARAERAIAARRVVVAAGSWSALLPGARIAAGAVRPVRGQMLALAAPRASARWREGSIPNARVLAGAGGYVVPRADRMLVGATVEEVGFSKAVTPEGSAALRKIAARLMPALANEPILESWSGLRPASRDGLPLLGAPASGPSGLFVCTGHYRSGILLTPISAELIRDALLGKPTAIDLAPFRPDRF